jgi:hypothetical protein
MNGELVACVVALVWLGLLCLDVGQWLHTASYHGITLLARWQSVFGGGAFVAWLEQSEHWQWLRPIVRAYFLLPASVAVAGPLYLCYQAVFGRRG